MNAATLRIEAAAVAAYREARTAYYAACKRADAAFVRYCQKLQSGERTNGAAAMRLDNRASELSADLYGAQSKLYALGLDPWDYDDEDGVNRTPLGS